MRAYERLLNYVTIHTTSDEATGTTPSTARQFDLARCLVEEMKALGIEDARVDDKCYVYGTIPATPGCENAPGLGFIAHLDTAPDFSGENVKPRVIPDYDGGEVKLGDSGRVLSPKLFPELSLLKGRTLICTDGTTLLGADDKAGIAEIMTAAETLLKGDKPHGKICLAFTPDEEIGSGAEDLDIPAFGAKYAYTVDGGAENEIVYETFNACAATFTIVGRSVHPGEAKGKMINAALLACEINNMLPGFEIPACTEMYEGFFHLTEMKGDVSNAELHYIVRDHSAAHFEARQEMLRHIEKAMNEKYGAGCVTLSIRQQYRNMEEKLTECMHLVENAKAVIRSLGMEPDLSPVRGGTDGAQLSFRGLPCPNLGTGGYAFHGPFEHITAEGMDTVVQVILGICDCYAKM
ncbi:MAG: peptidase T [Verrucomicrobia bacterium]|nr:peptidase T [Verrucomicrobiota bacterium]